MRTLICTLVVFVSTTAFAQNDTRPGPAHELFAREAGTWDCQVKMYYKGPDAPPTVTKGVEINELVSGDLYMRTTFTYEARGRTFEGHSLIGYDPRSRRYVGIWVDNFTTIPSQIGGEYDAETKTLTAYRTIVNGVVNEMKVKDVTTWTDESNKKLEIFMLIDANGKQIQIKLMESVAVKRK